MSIGAFSFVCDSDESSGEIDLGAEEEIGQERSLVRGHRHGAVGRRDVRVCYAHRSQRIARCSGQKRIGIRRIIDNNFVLPRAIETPLTLDGIEPNVRGKCRRLHGSRWRVRSHTQNQLEDRCCCDR